MGLNFMLLARRQTTSVGDLIEFNALVNCVLWGNVQPNKLNRFSMIIVQGSIVRFGSPVPTRKSRLVPALGAKSPGDERAVR